ncbi:MAG: alpha/beta hydrolase [Planctomycetota bacterium]
MNSFLWRIGRTGVVVYLGILLIMLCLERFLVYPTSKADPDHVDANEFGGEDIHFESADGTKLHGWYFENPQARGHLLFCHGNGDMVPWLGGFGQEMRDRYGLSVFVFDYRGYGLSEGKPFEKGVLEDSEAARKWFANKCGIPIDEVILMGQSLGGGVAVHLAANGGAKGLILQCTFDTLTETSAYHYPWLPVRTLMRNRYDSISKIGQYQGPLLQSHGTADNVVPYELGQKLFAAANEPKQFFTLEYGGHSAPENPKYDTLLEVFLFEITNPGGATSTQQIHNELP